jgi:hypothetical protein
MKFVSDLRQVGGFFGYSLFLPPIKLNVVESGVKHHTPTPNTQKQTKLWELVKNPKVISVLLLIRTYNVNI